MRREGDTMFVLGFSAATILWFFVRRWEDARIDRDIEARLLLLDRERGKRIFDRHQRACPCGRRIAHTIDEDRAVRDPEWTDGKP